MGSATEMTSYFLVLTQAGWKQGDDRVKEGKKVPAQRDFPYIPNRCP